MIAKISTGADPVGLARYLMGPGRETPHTYRDERKRLHEGGQVIGGTVTAGADRMRWARDLERSASANTQVTKPVWHCSLRAAPTDRRLTDAEWADIGQDVAEHMGYGEHPWAMVRHDDDHVHIVVSRVDFEGMTWKNSHDRWKVVEAMRAVEQRYELTEVASPARRSGR
ncbi:relaxase/mobilization nuclease domain-containing protein [Tomitella cavernea]|uniref:MobA/VirD2-like nuclease domain-containing protein n=1 Tax=Tomitella cavernea TaxID=1387982 RepID=A0ABP9D4K9_9ACTN